MECLWLKVLLELTVIGSGLVSSGFTTLKWKPFFIVNKMLSGLLAYLAYPLLDGVFFIGQAFEHTDLKRSKTCQR